MKAIIIEEKDALALLDQLKLEHFVIEQDHKHNALTPHDIHRRFHRIVTQWLQEQGADCVR